jgi:hypothetical protein
VQVLQHRRIRQTPGTFAFAPFGRLLRPAVAYGDGYSNPPIPGDETPLNMEVEGGALCLNPPPVCLNPPPPGELVPLPGVRHPPGYGSEGGHDARSAAIGGPPGL